MRTMIINDDDMIIYEDDMTINDDGGDVVEDQFHQVRGEAKTGFSQLSLSQVFFFITFSTNSSKSSKSSSSSP